MLEGKEFEHKIGDFGSASVDVKDDGTVEVAVALKVDLLAELEKLAAKTAWPIDDTAVAALKKWLRPA